MATYTHLKILERWAVHSFQYADISFRRILNEMTGNTIVSESSRTPGSYFQDVYWANEQDAVVLDNPAVQATATDEEFSQLSQFDIKVAARMKPFIWQGIAHKWMNSTPRQQAIIWGRTLAESMMKLKVNAITQSLVATFGLGLLSSGKDTVVETAIDDQSGGTSAANDKRLDFAKLVNAQYKFGDMAGLITGCIMHSGAYVSMFNENLRAYSAILVYPGLLFTRTLTGLPIFVTDNPILKFDHSGVTKYRTLLLTPRSAILRDHTDLEVLIEKSGGMKWIQTRAQAEQTFSLKIKAMSWKDQSKVHPEFASAKSPNTSLLSGIGSTADAIDTPGSWRRVGMAESAGLPLRELAGVMVISQ